VKFPSVLGGSYVAQSPIALNERTVNMYPEILQMPGGKSQVQLYPTPGVSAFATSTSSPARGGFYQNGRCFYAMGTTLQEVSSAGALTDRGTLSYATSDPVTFAANGDAGDELMAVAGGVVYMLDLNTNTLTTPTVNGTPVMCAYLDGYFMFLDTTSTLYVSGLFDGSTWDATQFAQRSAAPDPWQAVFVNKSNKAIWLCGEETSEAWYNDGSFPFPFTPIPGSMIPWGIAAPFSMEQVGASVLWLTRSSDGHASVIQIDGLAPRVISTPALETALQSYADISDAIGDTYSDLGHTFYVLTFPSAGHTWVYDLTTGVWHERGEWSVADNQFKALRTLYHTFAFGHHLVGDRQGGTIYQQDSSFTTDVDGTLIRRLRRTPSFFYENKRLFYSRLELMLEPGLALASGQGSDPQVMLRVSNDGGKTWGAELSRSAGARGQYGTRVYWNRLGSARDRVFEFTMSDPVPWRLIDAYLDVQPGTEAA
jgi:hypothetical protein